VRLEKSGGAAAERSLELEHEVQDLHSTLELRTVQFFNEYRIAALINTFAGIGLFGLLVWAAVNPDYEVGLCLAAVLVGASCGPAGLSIGILSRRWHTNTADVRNTTSKIERKLFG
jgi:hypothetical protein